MKIGYAAFLLKVLALHSVAGSEISEISGQRKPVFGADVKLTCGNQRIALEISPEYILKNGDWIADSKRLCLTNRRCCARQKGEKFLIDIDGKFTECGNQISSLEAVNQNGSLSVTHYKFTNKLIYDGGSGSIARDTLLLNFHCLYTSDLLVTAKPDDSDLSARVIRIKKISGEMEVSESSTFDRESTVLKKEKVYVKVVRFTRSSRLPNWNTQSNAKLKWRELQTREDAKYRNTDRLYCRYEIAAHSTGNDHWIGNDTRATEL